MHIISTLPQQQDVMSTRIVELDIYIHVHNNIHACVHVLQTHLPVNAFRMLRAIC